MSHLAADVLYAAVFDRISLDAEAALHLAQCAECRRAQAELAELAGDLALGRAVSVTAVTAERYAALFSEVQQSPGRLTSLWRNFTAHLAWDSRRQPSLQGVRSAAGAAGYRMLYSSDVADVELLVESDGRLLRMQGEWVARDDARQSQALVQWFAADGALLHETESGNDGQFALRSLQPGIYRLSILSAAGDNVEIEALEIS